MHCIIPYSAGGIKKGRQHSAAGLSRIQREDILFLVLMILLILAVVVGLAVLLLLLVFVVFHGAHLLPGH